MLLIKARTLEHEQPRHKARDKKTNKKKTQQNQRSPSRSVLERQSTHEINYGCSLCKTLIEDHSDGATDEAFREQEFCSFKGVEVGLRIRRGLCSQLAHRGQRSGQVLPLTKSFKPSRPRADGGGRERDAVECLRAHLSQRFAVLKQISVGGAEMLLWVGDSNALMKLIQPGLRCGD